MTKYLGRTFYRVCFACVCFVLLLANIKIQALQVTENCCSVTGRLSANAACVRVTLC